MKKYEWREIMRVEGLPCVGPAIFSVEHGKETRKKITGKTREKQKLLLARLEERDI